MRRILPSLGVLLLAVFGAWGCAKAPEQPAAAAERFKALEAKSTRLEGDLRAASAVREQLRQQLAEGETNQIKLRDEVDRLNAVVKERDALKKQVADLNGQLKARTTERDAAVAQFNNFRQILRAQLDQMEPSTTTGQAMPNISTPTRSGS